jgi:hypothetical protein
VTRRLRINQQRLCGISLQARVSLEALSRLFGDQTAEEQEGTYWSAVNRDAVPATVIARAKRLVASLRKRKPLPLSAIPTETLDAFLQNEELLAEMGQATHESPETRSSKTVLVVKPLPLGCDAEGE